MGRLAHSVGQAPGVISIDSSWPRPVLSIFAYGPEGFLEKEIRVDEVEEYLGTWPVVWLNVDGLGDEQTLNRLGEIFSLHRLALEDVVNLGQRAKVEAYDEDVFIVARTPDRSNAMGEQVTFFSGSGFRALLPGALGRLFRRRQGENPPWQGANSKERSGLSEPMLSSMPIVDSYFPVLEEIAESLVSLEKEVLESPDQSTVSQVYEIKRRLQELRRTIAPHREALNALIRDTGHYVSDETGLHFRDTYDHTIRISEMVDSQRDLCSDLMATYLSVVSNRMNDVMKVLSIIGTVFIPLGFIAGLYGMNFDPGASPFNMPELGWYLGYPFALLLMGSTAVGLLLYFWRKGWFR